LTVACSDGSRRYSSNVSVHQGWDFPDGEPVIAGYRGYRNVRLT
jgi:hypothetical protein